MQQALILFRVLLPCLLLAAALSPVSAADLSIGFWPAEGYSAWRIGFPATSTTASTVGSGASELYYPLSGTYITARYRSNPIGRYYFTADGGFMKSLSPAAGSDADWNYANSSQYWYYGNFKTTGSSGYLQLSWHRPVRADTEIFYGYSYRNNHFHMTDGFYTVNNYQSVQTSLPLLNSSYNLRYQGPHIGLQTTKKLNTALSAVGSVTYTPLALVQGHGWGNLRELDFAHIGPGQMWDAQLALQVKVPKTDGTITVGYRCQWLDVYTGTENTNDSITWEKAATIQKGLFLAGQLRF